MPFVVFFALLLAADYLHQLFGAWEYTPRVTVLALVLFSVLPSCYRFTGCGGIGITLAMGVAVFAIWVGPDLLIPGYGEHWLFRIQLPDLCVVPFSTEFRHSICI